jgi:uncharacterized tellurite resistance protein B-like protein
MLKRLLNAYRLVATDARNAVADQYHQVVDPDADEDGAFFAVATKKLCAGALFCEMAMADGKIAPEELERVRDLLLVRFGLDDAEADALFKIGQQATADSSRLPRMTASVATTSTMTSASNCWRCCSTSPYADGEQSPREVEIAEQAGAATACSPATSPTPA